MKKIIISLVHYSSPETTYDCMKSIAEIDTHNMQIRIYITNNNTSESLDDTLMKKFKVDYEIFESTKNLGYSGGHNANIKKAIDRGADYVLMLNSDTQLHKSLLINLLQAIDQTVDAGIVVPKIYFYPGDEFHSERYTKDELGRVVWYAGGIIDWKNVISSHRGVDEVDQGQFDTVEPTEFATGACMLVSLGMLKKVGMFDERYFLYYEDCDFSMRVRKSGYSILYAPQAVMWHKNAKSTGGSGSQLQDYFITRNRMLFGMKYAPLRSKFALIRESIRLLISGRTWQRRGIRDYYLRRFGKGSYPVRK